MRPIFTLTLVVGSFLVGIYYCMRFISPSTPCMVVSPTETSPSTLSVTMTVVADETASDGKGGVKLQFYSIAVGGNNCVNFSHGEMVTCNNDGNGPLAFDSTNKFAYVTRVGPTGDYTCAYQQSSRSTPLVISIPRGTPLRPQFLPSNQSGLTVTYNPNNDSRLGTCQVEVDVNGSPSAANLPDNGQYTIPNISGLSGQGSIVITRTCTPSTQRSRQTACPCQQTAFSSVTKIYKSIATLAMIWNPTDP
jgi:hypothetical protein